jgi:predicted GNAT family acetyltransferase
MVSSRGSVEGMTLTDKTGAPVTVHKESDKFTIAVDGKTVGLTEYADEGRSRVFPHTEVNDGFEGRGLGSIVIGEALAQTRAEGLRIVPQCPMVVAYVDKHPEYADIVDRPER